MQEREIVINPDETVSVIRREVIKTISLPEYLDTLRAGEFITPILPYGTIQAMFKAGGLRKAFVIQVQPLQQEITLEAHESTPNGRTTGYRKFKLWIPWVIYGVKFAGNTCENVWVRFARTRILKPDDTLYYPPMSNISLDGKVCMGNSIGEVINKEKTVEDKAVVAVHDFWASSFVDDSTPDEKAIPDLIWGRDFLHIYERWEDLGEKALMMRWKEAETYETYTKRLFT